MKKILFLLFFPLLGFAESDLHVQLATESSLEPLYLCSIENRNSEFSERTLESMRKVLQFDFNYNGFTRCLAKTSERTAQESKERGLKQINQAAWKALSASYVLKLESSGKTLSASLYSTTKTKVMHAGPIELQGKLSEDRHIIHRLADSLFESMTGQAGIATTKILYTVNLPNSDPNYKSKWKAEVWEADWDGANAHQVTHEERFCVTPCYLPPKPGNLPGSFFYVSYALGQPRICMGSLRTGEGTRVISLRGNQLMPAVSKKRNLIAFICDVQGNPDLFVQSFDPTSGPVGVPRQIFATVHGTQGSPAFSPDGEKIAFVSNKDGNPRIYMMPIPPEGMKARDMQPKLISKQCKENTSPTWSPDGKKLAYSAMVGGVRQIWIYDFETHEEMQLTSGEGNKENPSWAPDSLHLVFNSSTPDNHGCELYLVNLNQNEAVKISDGVGEKRFPNWQPK